MVVWSDSMKSCYIPYIVKSNKYVENIQRVLESAGIQTYSLKECLKSFKLFKQIKVFNFNWFEGTKYNNSFLVLLDYISKIIFIYLLKIFNKKIIWTMHNKVSHDTKFEKLSKTIIKVFCKKSDYIVIHCNESIDLIQEIYPKVDIKKFKFIEHPNYIGSYKINNSISRKDLSVDEDDLVFLFFGAVRPYKNIELLVDVFNDLKEKNIKLIIAGKPMNKEYEEKIKNMSKENEGIKLLLDFIPDEEVQAYYNICNIVVLPYDYKSMLNSGSVYLSFSLSKIVICPEIGTVKDIDDKDIVYSYQYDSEIEHKQRLKEIIKTIYSTNKDDKTYIGNSGEKSYKYVSEKHSNNIIKKKYLNLYTNA